MISVVSIILPTYNESPSTLIPVLKSIITQDYSDFELIIVDDSDNLETKEILFKFSRSDSRVKIIYPELRLGLSSALNIGINNAIGNYIARADSDDIMVSSRIGLQKKFLDENLNIDIVGSAVYKIDTHNNYLGIRKYPITHKKIKKISTIRNPMAHPTIMARKSVFIKYGCYDESYLKAEDYELWLRFIKFGVIFANLATPLIYYKLADESKRDRINWSFNLKAKIKYFGFDEIFLRSCGIFLALVMASCPGLLLKLFSKIYNKRI